MTDETTTTGTESQDGGNALESAAQTGTPAGDNRNAESGDGEIANLKALVATLQEKAGRVNALEARFAELEASASTPAVREDENDEELLKINRELADRGDAAAKLALRERDERLRDKRQAIVDRDLSRLDEAEAKAVEEHIRRHPGRFGDVKAARNDLRANKLEDELRDTRKELERLKRGPDAEVKNAPPTQGREYSARETKARDMTYDGFDTQLAELRGSGKQKEAMQLQRELNEGKIRLKN